MRVINTVILHCSDSTPNEGCDASVIHEWHLDKGWDGVGYHYIILENGETETGRPLCWIGSHVFGHNDDSIAICLIGKGNYFKSQMIALLRLLDKLINDFPNITIHEHNEYDCEKTCPNFSEEDRMVVKYFFGDKYIYK